MLLDDNKQKQADVSASNQPSSINRLRSLSIRTSDGQIAKMVEPMTELLKRENIDTVYADGQQLGLTVDALLFCKKVNSAIAYFMYVVDNGALGTKSIKLRANPLIGNNGEIGESVTLPYVPGDLTQLENDFTDAVQSYIAQKYDTNEIFIAGIAPLHKFTQNLVDRQTGLLPKSITDEMSLYVASAINSLFDDVTLRVADITDKLVITSEFTDVPAVAASGLPLHRSFEITARQESRRSNTRETFSLARSVNTALTSISGWMDITPKFEQKDNTSFNVWSYDAHINCVKSLLGYNNTSLSLFALANAVPYVTGNGRLTPLQRSLRDPSRSLMALNRDLPKELNFDIAAEDFDFVSLSSRYFTSQVSNVILHISESAEEAVWLQSLLTVGSSTHGDEYDSLYDELVAMFETDKQRNTFEGFFPRGTPFGEIHHGQRDIEGYYLDDADTPVSIQSFDYLHQRTLIERQVDMTRLDNTYSVGEDLDKRVAERIAILKEFFPNLVVTGYSRPYTVSGELLSAIWNSTMEIVSEISIEGNSSVNTGVGVRRGRGNLSNLAIDANSINRGIRGNNRSLSSQSFRQGRVGR